ncbi:MAG: hypothetical protein ACRD2C_08200 [Acidimicrobiales bacterium]
MLSPLDDYPIHQVPEPVRRVGTSDRNFYDRYYFNCMSTGEDESAPFLIMGMGQYPNLGVADAFAVVVHDGIHRVVRSSCALGLDRMDTTVGPFSVAVLRGLEELRFRLDSAVTDTGDDTSLSFDLTWLGAERPIEEPRHRDRDAVGRIFLDACRMAQTGVWTGSLRIGDRIWDITPGQWWGSRDRSWGIRPSGESEPPGITAHLPSAGFRWLYVPVRFEDQSVFVICQSRNDGSRVLEEAIRVWRTPSGEGIEHLGRPDYELAWDDDNRFVTSATVWAGKHELAVEPVVPVHLGVGTGYGFDAEWRHGRYVDDLVVQERQWDLRTEEGRAAMWGIVDAASRFTLDGQRGHGLFEYLMI